jgi:hypothetical protein
MRHSGIDRLALALAASGSRRGAIVACSALLAAGGAVPVFGKRRGRRDPADSGKRRQRSRKQRDGRRRDGKKEGFDRDCRRFVLAGGPDRDDKFKHIDDDVLIELISKGRNSEVKVLLEDDNDEPNGDDGSHLKVSPFTARVGDKIRIVARNEVVGGCELDEIWLHCIEGRGGKVKLADAVTPEECRADANRVGVFEERTVRIRNK